MGDRSAVPRLIHHDATAAQLALVRVVVCGAWLFVLLRDPVHLLADLPRDVLEPPGLLRALPDAFWSYFMDERVLLGCKWGLIALLAASLFGIPGAQLAAILSAIGLTLYSGLVRSYTFINHAELGILYASWALAIFPAYDALALRRSTDPTQQRERAYALGLQLMCYIVVSAYTAIGLYRVAKSAPEIFFGDTMTYSIAKNTFRASFYGFEFGAWVLREPGLQVLVKLGYLMVTAFEVLSFLALLNRRFRIAWMVMMVTFHVITLLTMNLFFWHNLLLLFVLFTDFNPLIQRMRAKVAQLIPASNEPRGVAPYSSDTEGAVARVTRLVG